MYADIIVPDDEHGGWKQRTIALDDTWARRYRRDPDKAAARLTYYRDVHAYYAALLSALSKRQRAELRPEALALLEGHEGDERWRRVA
jgi:hypothetical protein